MIDTGAIMSSMIRNASEMSAEQLTLQRSEGLKTTRLQMIEAEMQADRSRKNIFRKQMDAILADAMNTLKKTSEQIKQATGG